VLSLKNLELCSVGGARSKSSIFSRFWGTPWLSCTQPTGNSFTPNQWYRWKAETLKVCLFLVRRVYDQAFGRYRPLNGAKKSSRDHHENWNWTDTRRRVHWFQNAILFDLRRKLTKLSRKNRSRTVASPDAYERLAVLNWRSSSIHPSSFNFKKTGFLTTFFSLQHVLTRRISDQRASRSLRRLRFAKAVC